MRSPGFVYVMTNAQIRGMVKIGKTPGPPEDSTQEVLAGGAVDILQLRDAVYFSDAHAAENFIHDQLAMYGDRTRPGYFAVALEVATDALAEAMARLVGTRMARRQGTVSDDDQSGSETFAQAENMRASYPAAALLHFERAARAGEARAYIALAGMYENGEGVDPDPQRALEWLQKGARANVRECQGALAERYIRLAGSDAAAYVNARSCIRSYFQGLNLVAIPAEHLPVVISRMRLYMKILQRRVEAEDHTLIPQILEGLTARLHQDDESADRSAQAKTLAAWSKKWQVLSGRKRRPLVSPLMKVVLGVTLAGSVTFVLIPAVRQRDATHTVTGGPQVQPLGTEEPAPVSPPPVKARPRRRDQPIPERPGTVTTAVVKPKSNQPAAAPPVSVVAPAPSQPAPAPLEQISAEQLTTHFDVDKAKATAAFKNETVRITDVVTKRGKHDISFKKVKCKFDADTAVKPDIGSRATVEGVVRGKGFWTGTITLEHCRVLP